MVLGMPFVKGHIGHNKGKKLVGEWRNCLRCGKKCWFNLVRILNGGGKYCSRDCSNKANAKKGEESWNYKRNSNNYSYDETIPYVSKGVPKSEETKRKISASLKRYFSKL